MDLERGAVKNEDEAKDPYSLTAAQRRMPKGKLAERQAWLDEVMTIQLDGVAHGVRPQGLTNLPPYLSDIWRSRVWSAHLKSLTPEARNAATKADQGTERHTRPSAGGSAPRIS